MLLATIENILVEASSGLRATCPHCGSTMIARCGDFRKKHWAHAKRDCDDWQSGKETDWHYNWKKTIGLEFAEKKITKEGIYHIADILICDNNGSDNLIIEFQNSPLAQNEIENRESFYGKGLIWIINGTALGEKFFVDKFFLSFHVDYWSFFPKYDFYFLDDNHLLKQGAMVISIPQSKYSPEFEKFLFSMGYSKHGPTFKHIINDKNYYIDRRYYKSLINSGFKENVENINAYIEEFKNKSLNEFKRVVSNKNICKTRYVWKYSRQAFNFAKNHIFIDLNNEELFQIKNGCVQGGCEGKLIKKEYFMARIKKRIDNSKKGSQNSQSFKKG